MFTFPINIIIYRQLFSWEMAGFYRIAGNFRGRKLSWISWFFSHPWKFSPRNSRHATPIMRPILTFHESFLREMLLSHRSAKVFSLENFSLDGILAIFSPSLPPSLPPRCGGMFCALHRYAETHSCNFDYKAEGRRLIARNNPIVMAPKLPKIWPIDWR